MAIKSAATGIKMTFGERFRFVSVSTLPKTSMVVVFLASAVVRLVLIASCTELFDNKIISLFKDLWLIVLLSGKPLFVECRFCISHYLFLYTLCPLSLCSHQFDLLAGW